jgi:hypothetical protein
VHLVCSLTALILVTNSSDLCKISIVISLWSVNFISLAYNILFRDEMSPCFVKSESSPSQNV